MDRIKIGDATANFPQPLIDITLNCSKEDPSQRYESVDEVVEVLDRLRL